MNRRVAIIGYSFKFPQTSPATFWQDLLDRKDFITQVDPTRWAQQPYLHPDSKHPGTTYTFKAGSLGDISGFDAEFFGISPREAAHMDPQQRLLLEMSWEAIEHSGIRPSCLRKTRCGVFLGISSSDYVHRMDDDVEMLNASSATGNTSSIAANRISYLFDLQGPSIALDTACSSSLVAFHQACQSIASGETDTALTGGVSLHLHPFGFISFSKATMLSPDGRCKVFDASANGYVRSEGGGMLLLKDYDKAIADGDTIHAVVAASAVNTDGYKPGMTIPSCTAQQRLMEEAYQQAGIHPDEIDYIEAHGTGTPVGDPIETRAIGRALGSARLSPLPIGSIKSNIGHLEPASGVAGLMKALYALRHRCVPATISMQTPNPDIQFDDWNIRVVDEHMPLKADGTLTIGVNSFGFGGANAHVVLQSPDQNAAEQETPRDESPLLPLIISARSPAALKANAQQLKEYLTQDSAGSFYDLAWHYSQHKERLADSILLYARNKAEIQTQLEPWLNDEDILTKSIYTGKGLSITKGPVFVYSGNGCQWTTMGKNLVENCDVFCQSIKLVDELFSNYADFSLLSELQGLNGADRFSQTEIAQPALFALQVGITEHLRSRGIVPVAVTGHSVGEVAAAWACGALSLADAVKVIYHRSLYQGQTRGQGQMTAVGLGQTDMEALLAEHNFSDICLAGANSYRGTTLAGDPEQLGQIEAILEHKKVFNRRLPLDYAFHSPAMDPTEQALLAALQGLTPQQGQIPFYSTVSGQLQPGEQLEAEYWWHNIRKPVLFEQAVDQILADGINGFIEIGGHPVLRSYLQDQLRQSQNDGVILTTLSRDDDSPERLEHCIAAALIADLANTSHYFPVTGKRLELPTYQWNHESYWHPSTTESCGLLNRYAQHPLLGYSQPLQPLHWENRLDTACMQWLADHQVGDSIIYPGAGFMELALAAASQFRQADVIEVEELEILSPLVLDALHSKKIQTLLDEQSGQISISNRAYSGGDQWTLNAKARAVHQSTGQALKLQAPILPERQPDFSAQDHHQLTVQAGLQYGPAFSAVARGWQSEHEVLAELALATTLNDSINDYYLHPGLLDSSFQLIIHFLQQQLAQNNGTVFVPARIGRLTLARNSGYPTTVRVQLLRKSSHSVLARFELFNRAGKPIAVIEEARFKAIRLHQGNSDALALLDYHLTAIPRRHALTVIEPVELQHALAQALLDSESTSERFTHEVVPLLDTLIEHAVGEALLPLADTHLLISKASIEQLNQHDEQHQPLRLQALNLAVQRELAHTTTQGWQLDSALTDNEISSQLIWNTLVRDYPDYFSAIQLAGRTSLHLAAQLAGKQDSSTDLIHSERYSTLFSTLFNQSRQAAVTRNLRQLLNQQQARLNAGQRLQVMELSGAAPLFSSDLCNALDFRLADYCFASHNPDALETINHLQEQYPLARSLDLTDQSALEQTANYQLLLVNLDECSPRNTLNALEQLRPQMAEDASLILIGLEPMDWLDITFGAAEDWWQDDRNVLASASQWQDTLARLGYRNLHCLHDDSTDSGFFLLSAQLPRTQQAHIARHADNQHWLLLGSSTPQAEQLSQSLCQQGIPCSHSTLSERDSLSTLLAEQALNSQPFSQIIHLSQLGENGQPQQSQTDRCSLATELMAACDATACKATISLITQGVGATLPCDQPAFAPDSINEVPADAALWGFGRTLMNEAVGYNIRLIDLPATLTEQAIAELVDELQSPSSEPELAINAQGQRFAPRLRREEIPNAEAAQAEDDQTVRLGFNLPGQLRNLQWQAHTAEPLAEDDIEVDIRATGLNFRDVMYALGLLSDEAIENGFAGATLGLEFAGEVSRVGNAVTDYQPGDAVVGFGPACFSNRTLAKANALSKIPAGISFEGAATIPSTFFTVYYALHHLARLQPGEKILIHGAAGGVGIAAIQIAQWIGAEIYATAGSQEKHDFLRLLGVENIYSSRELTFAEEILRDTADGRGVDLVLNSLAGEAINQNLRVLKPFGRFIELGKRDFYENTHIGLRPFRNNISYFGVDADQLMQERPELTHRLYTEMMALFDDGTLFPLPYTRFEGHQITDAFRYMQQAKQIGKIVVTYNQELTADTSNTPAQHLPQLQLNPDASYLVTGGLGGFGLRTAQWLVDKGARHLLLLSRRGATSEEAQTFLQQCKAKGVQAHALACDVTDRDALAQIINRCGHELPPLRGVVHAATVIEDGLIRNLDRQKISNSLAAKLTGAQHLDSLTRSLELDLFVLYSSATTLLGNPGQAAYVAANQWLEALSAVRQSHGLAATCVRWGAIDDVGFLARNEAIKDALQHRIGGAALDSGTGLAVLEQMILADTPARGVMELDWGPLSRFLPTSGQNKFREIALSSQDTDQGDEGRLDLEQMMSELSDKEFHNAIVDILRHELSEILMIASSRIDAERSIYDMGLDSLMGVELMSAIENRLGIQVPVMALSETPTLSQLADKLISQIRGDDDTSNDASDETEAAVQRLSAQHGAQNEAQALQGLELASTLRS